MGFGSYPCENCGAATLNTTYCGNCNPDNTWRCPADNCHDRTAIVISPAVIALEELITCPNCGTTYSAGEGLCALRCGLDTPGSQHRFHGGKPCGWHARSCEEASNDPSLWCMCGREGITTDF